MYNEVMDKLNLVKWIDLMGENVMRYVWIVVILSILTRVLSYVFSGIKQVEITMYICKGMMNFLLVTILLGSFYVNGISLENMDIMTGFTFLFCVMEAADNFSALICCIGDRNVYDGHLSIQESIAINQEEEEFRMWISNFLVLSAQIKRGYINTLCNIFIQMDFL